METLRPELFDGLADTLQANSAPRVSLIEGSGLLPGSRFYSAVVPDVRPKRDLWRQGLMESTSGVDLVFVDPDNGIEIPSKPLGRKDSSKYITWSEVEQIWETGCSVLIYQHFPHEPHEAFAAGKVSELRRHTGARFAHAFHFLPFHFQAPFQAPPVLFLLVSQVEHEDGFSNAVSCLASRWEGRIKVMELANNSIQQAALRAAADPGRSLKEKQ
jgi:hypothetical protein